MFAYFQAHNFLEKLSLIIPIFCFFGVPQKHICMYAEVVVSKAKAL